MFWSGLKSMISSIRYVQIGPKNKAYRGLAPECGGLSTKKKVWGPHWKEKVKTVLREQTINILSLQTQITLTNSNTFTHFSHSNTDLGVTVFTLYNGSTSCRRVSCRVHQFVAVRKVFSGHRALFLEFMHVLDTFNQIYACIL